MTTEEMGKMLKLWSEHEGRGYGAGEIAELAKALALSRIADVIEKLKRIP